MWDEQPYYKAEGLRCGVLLAAAGGELFRYNLLK